MYGVGAIWRRLSDESPLKGSTRVVALLLSSLLVSSGFAQPAWELEVDGEPLDAIGTLRLDGIEVPLVDFAIMDLGDSVHVVAADRPLDDVDPNGTGFGAFQGFDAVLELDDGTVSVGFAKLYHGNTWEWLPEQTSIQVEQLGDRTFQIDVQLDQQLLEISQGQTAALEARIRFQREDPCASPRVRIGEAETPPTRAFAEIYRAWAECRFAAMSDLLAPSVAAQWEEALADDNEAWLAGMAESPARARREIEIRTARSNDAAVELEIQLVGYPKATTEATMRLVDGRWKLASGLIF